MVKEEHGICDRGKGFVQYVHTTATEIALTVRRPLRARHARGGDHVKRTLAKHIPSQDEMRSRVRIRDAPKMAIESDIVPRIRVHGGIHSRLSECRVDQQLGVLRRAGEEQSSEQGLKSKITTDVVRNGVGDFDILEATGEDLVVVLRVTPRAETVVSRVGKDRRVVKVRGIYSRIRTDTQQVRTKALPCVQSQ